MKNERWKPTDGETYYLVSDYSPEPYEYVWNGSKADIGRWTVKTLYPTKETALEAKKQTNT